MSYLLAVGDSWTDATFKSEVDSTIDCSFPKWPELLGNQIGISRVVNLGLCGASNDFIFKQCYDKIVFEKEKPKLICVLLSSWDRRELFNYQFNTITNLEVDKLNKDDNFPIRHAWLKEYHAKNIDAVNMATFLWRTHMDLQSVMIETLRSIFLFQSFCAQNDIDYIIMQGILPIPLYSSDGFTKLSKAADRRLHKIDNYVKYVLDSPYASKINDSTIVGWPFFWQIGGYAVEDKFTETDHRKYEVHPHDNHPNALGHQLMADMFYKRYQDIYGKVS